MKVCILLFFPTDVDLFHLLFHSYLIPNFIRSNLNEKRHDFPYQYCHEKYF